MWIYLICYKYNGTGCSLASISYITGTYYSYQVDKYELELFLIISEITSDFP